jgi:uncharacterized protein YjiS (DUF1127 family)
LKQFVFLEHTIMIRLTELATSPAGTTAERWGQRSLDVNSVIVSARTLRAEFIADHLHRTVKGFGRWSGLTAVTAGLRRRLQERRTLKALASLDDRLLSDIGLSRAEIAATAALCCDAEKESTVSVWQKLGHWLSRERARRRTVRELSAIPDSLLADVGISRADIPAIAAALVTDQPVAASTDTPAAEGNAVPVSAQVLAFIEVRRSVQRAANQNVVRPAA